MLAIFKQFKTENTTNKYEIKLCKSVKILVTEILNSIDLMKP